MAKKRRKSDGPPHQPLFDYIDRIQAAKRKRESAGQGAMDIEAKLRRALSAALKQCPLSVPQVAGEMSHLLDDTITADMIYSWTAESKTMHQIWGSRLPAFCRVTGDHRPIDLLVESVGRFCLPGREALRAEIHRFAEAEKKARAEKRRRELFLAEMEGR